MTPAIVRRTCLASGIAASALLFASRASAQTYKIDDGTPGYAMTYALPDDFCWLNRLTVTGTVTLTSVEAILGDAPEGYPVSFCIWQDWNGFGQPWDGMLLARVDTHVRNSADQLLTQYAIPPTQVSGSFFVGAFLTVDGNFSPATLDPHTPTAGRSWFATGFGPGSFDPTHPGWYSWYAPPTIGLQGVFMLRANGVDGPSPDLRCVAKTNSLGCVPQMAFAGTCSASASSGFTVTASNVRNRQPGILIYSLAGVQQVPFQGGQLCIRPPIVRTPVVNSGGSPTGVDCSGSYVFDFNAWIASGHDRRLVPGITVDAQFWSRDPGFEPATAIGLTQGAHFGIAP